MVPTYNGFIRTDTNSRDDDFFGDGIAYGPTSSIEFRAQFLLNLQNKMNVDTLFAVGGNRWAYFDSETLKYWYSVVDLGNGTAQVTRGSLTKKIEHGKFSDKSSIKIVVSNSQTGPGDLYTKDEYSWEFSKKKPNI